MNPPQSKRRYRTIVADPPWEVERPVGGYGGNVERRQEVVARVGQTRNLDYPTMTVEEIAALPVRGLAVTDFGGPDRKPRREAGLSTHDGSHLFLWTTTQYVEAAHHVSRSWGFTPTALLVWCKPSGGMVGGTFYSNVEFVVYGRRGAPETPGRVNTRWFTWPRGDHSQKPEAFLDLVEETCPGPYLEMFARRARFGWDYWGNESLETAEVGEAA
jgi:N6-adenosine-specific RNA methylase IME4